jgi:hypothetical protein
MFLGRLLKERCSLHPLFFCVSVNALVVPTSVHVSEMVRTAHVFNGMKIRASDQAIQYFTLNSGQQLHWEVNQCRRSGK